MTLKLLVLALLATASPLGAQSPSLTPAARILERTRILASDAFEGRAPGSPGEEKTVAYLTAEFKKLGLQPGNPNG